jgi:membrane fusion protein, multidrug efflux system
VKTSLTAAVVAGPIAAVVLSACSQHKPAEEALRPVRTVELRYGNAAETNRYAGTIRARHEVDQSFRVGGKVVQRLIEVGQTVHEGDVLAVLDDTDYRLAEEAARQQLVAAKAQAEQAQSDRKRLEALKTDGSVSASDDEHAQSGAVRSEASAEAQIRQLELARNHLKYTVLHASQSGVVTSVRFEVGQVVAEGQAVVSIANESEPEVVVDVPEDNLASFKTAHFRASVASEPGETFEVALRELAPQAAQQTRTYRARLRPVIARDLPLGATATLTVDHPVGDASLATIPASALTQSNGQPAVWVVHRANTEPAGSVELNRITVHGYRNDQVLISGPEAGELVVTAGVQKMAPGLHVALAGSTPGTTVASTTPLNATAREAAP